MDGAVVKNAVVDFVGEEHKIVAGGEGAEGFHHGALVDRARGIVRIDHDEAPGALGDLAFQIFQVRMPGRALIAAVVHGLPAGEGDRRSPKGVVRGGDQHLVAVIDQALHGHDDKLGNAVADEYVFHVHALNALLLGALHDRLCAA